MAARAGRDGERTHTRNKEPGIDECQLVRRFEFGNDLRDGSDDDELESEDEDEGGQDVGI